MTDMEIAILAIATAFGIAALLSATLIYLSSVL